MEQDMKKIWGIDLGTTYSCISYVDEHGKPVVVKNLEGELTTPSVVFFDEGNNIVVGKAAKESARMYPEAVVSFVKRLMGDPNYLFGYADKTYRAEEISSYILRKLVEDAESDTGEKITDVVITCPAYFGINEKEATSKAGEIAGLNVRAILAEPTAAAIAWGKTNTSGKVVLVYDLGGGTFDITMIHVSQEKVEVIVTGGDHNLGGKDWDDAVIQYFAEQYRQQTGSKADVLEDAETYQQLQNLAESSKKILSVREKAPVAFSSATGERVKIEFTRGKFEEITRDLIERTISLTHDMLTQANKKGYEKFDEILMVGGSTKMPQIESRLKEEFQVAISSFDPDEAVAKGAALYGRDLMVNGELVKAVALATGKMEEVIDLSKVDSSILNKAEKEVAERFGFTLGSIKDARKKVINVISKSFGVVATDSQDNQEKVYNLILKNASVPIEISQVFGTQYDKQESVAIRIMENELSSEVIPLDRNLVTELGLAELEMPKMLPAGSPIKITFNLIEDGRLFIEAVEGTQNRRVDVTIQTASVIQGDELEEAKLRSSMMVVS